MMTRIVTGTTPLFKPGFSTSRPSTAPSTEIAGVMSASQKKNAVPASAAPTAPGAPLPAARRQRARRPQHGAAAALTAAAAREHLVDVRRVVGCALNLVVVGELLARLDGADRIDEHPSGLDHRFAVRLAGMIHETRLVAVDPGVDHGVRVDGEEESVVVARPFVVVAAIRLWVRYTLAAVLDDAPAARDARRREHPQAVQRRLAHLDRRRLLSRIRPAHTATGARIGA